MKYKKGIVIYNRCIIKDFIRRIGLVSDSLKDADSIPDPSTTVHRHIRVLTYLFENAYTVGCPCCNEMLELHACPTTEDIIERRESLAAMAKLGKLLEKHPRECFTKILEDVE